MSSENLPRLPPQQNDLQNAPEISSCIDSEMLCFILATDRYSTYIFLVVNSEKGPKVLIVCLADFCVYNLRPFYHVCM